MYQKMFSVYDLKAKIWLQPFCFRTIPEALRWFQQSAQDTNHPFCKFGSDFCLYEIGVFDDETGMVTVDHPPKSIATAMEVGGSSGPIPLEAAPENGATEEPALFKAMREGAEA